MYTVHTPLLRRPARCVLWDVGVGVTARRRGEGARMTFLQGGPKFEVTPLFLGLRPTEALPLSPAGEWGLPSLDPLCPPSIQTLATPLHKAVKTSKLHLLIRLNTTSVIVREFRQSTLQEEGADSAQFSQ